MALSVVTDLRLNNRAGPFLRGGRLFRSFGLIIAFPRSFSAVVLEFFPENRIGDTAWIPARKANQGKPFFR